MGLASGERVRPIAITLLDPIISAVIIGPFLYRFATVNPLHVVATILGAAAGVAIGYARARVMFVRAEKPTHSIVLRRSGLEYGLVLLLIIIRTAESSIDKSHTSFASTAVTALAALGLVEAISRSVFLVQRYRQAATPVVGGAESDE